ncbi:Hormone-sensitive lipase, putative [Pediculus humanus corporis]|uniref:Hormone-sensitive lipase, putative n=1 Tax=Pediculus humanus subsp. corporis TaxID=121224 RepID=E0VLI3_PEDHC|nr:Hormone-sensitive lipase, putative [Pediculus humanus corporis]EEB14239.1 Hormone-sensitive lipase, putative [Pediculus humanus corporis]
MEEPFGNAYIDELLHICSKNAEHYEKDISEYGQRMVLGFIGIIDHVNLIVPLVNNIKEVMSDFDFDEKTPGNGYRSFVAVVHSSFKHAFELSNYIAANKDSIIFRKGFYVKEVEAISRLIASLLSCLKYLEILLSWSNTGDLFPSAEHFSDILIQQSENINQFAFYGRCMGIQFCSSVQPVLKFISIFMASFSEIYYNFGGFSAKALSLFSGSKFLIDPELRAQRIVNISQNASIDFCKSFWFLTESELMKKIPDFICRSLAINHQIKIPSEPLSILNLNGEEIEIPIPSSHIPVNSIQVRLLSRSRRQGMNYGTSDGNKKGKFNPPSKSLILHCHGGGFVAQSSKTHEVYLRDWANELDVPIISVDYSLAPEAPFPRALEEVFYTYCWILKNSHLLGSTGENIILAGDSAGANLILGTTLKSIEYNIRKPSGLFVAYVPVIVSSTPSPSRLLCLMDPLLPLGFLLRCLKAYACPDFEVDQKGVPTAEEYNNKIHSDGTSTTCDKKLVCDIENSDSSSSGSRGRREKEFYECVVSNENYTLEKNSEDWEEEKKLNEANIILNSSMTGSQKRTMMMNENSGSTLNFFKRKISDFLGNAFFKTETKNYCFDKMDFIESNYTNSLKNLKFSVPKDPYLSPYWAPDDMLNQLPPTSICSVQFDPCLDDCVMFAKKLKKLGITVTLDILEGLPHGFLNLCKINKEAESGSKFCLQRIKELINTGEGNLNNGKDTSTPYKNYIIDNKSQSMIDFQ